MRFTTSLIPALFLTLSACASAPSTFVQQPPPASPTVEAPAKKAEVSAPVAKPIATLQTLSDKTWQITLPSTFVQTPNPDGSLDAGDKGNGIGVFLTFTEFPADLNTAELAITMGLADRSFEVHSSRGTFAGQEALLVSANLQTKAGKLQIKSWSAVSQGHLYNFGCLVLPTSPDVDAALQVCDAAAETVKLTLLPAPTPATPSSPDAGK